MVERDKGLPVWMVFALMAQTDHFYMEGRLRVISVFVEIAPGILNRHLF